VAASYVIGFASAFIAFGVTDANAPAALPVVAEYIESHEQTAVAAEKVKATTLRVEETGLVLVTEDLERLLSARKSSPLAANALTAANEPGFAERLVEAELSRDGKFAYFCEVLNESDTTCDAYVYDVEMDTIYPVKVNDTVYRPETETHRSSWSSSGNLIVDQFHSVSTSRPWILQ
jgi:hypothetical protein